MGYLGVDVGGTFTDVVYVGDDGDITATKVPSTPPHFDHGFMAGVEKVSRLRGMDIGPLLCSCDIVLHGTTVATNAMVQMRGAKIGIVTSRGHRDCLPAMRSSGRTKGLTAHEILHASSHYLPTQLVDSRLILEVDERLDARGTPMVGLDEAQVAEAAQRLLENGVQAVAICFLWSVSNPAHEQRAREIVRELMPEAFITCSHEASARTGEYERFTAAALNAFLGPETRGYVERLKENLATGGLAGRLVIMQASGGLASDERAARLPVLTIGSGPSAGVTASLTLSQQRGEPDVIATDMGGTSFDVALIADGSPLRSRTSVVNQYEFYLPRTDIRSIGAGGGSIVRYEHETETLKVGPTSAGASPGPVCYGQGATAPTVTDANLVLGYLNPGNFLGGEIVLDVAAAEHALGAIGAPLGMSALEVAVATRRIVVSQMADLIRQMTIERGMDPREFALYAYGGAGGLHVAAYMHELGCGHAVIPLGTLSTTWSAYGCATSDLLQIYERSLRMRSPIDMDVVNAAFDELEAGARRDLEADGIPAGRQVMERSVEIKYPLQIHQLDVTITALDTAEDLVSRFVGRYEQLYGIGSAWDEATVEMVGCRVVARGSLLQPMSTAVDTAAKPGEAIERSVVWIDGDGVAEEIITPVVSPEALPSAAAVAGPLIIESETTTVVVPPTASAVVTPHGDLMLQPVHGSASDGANAGGVRSVGAQAY